MTTHVFRKDKPLKGMIGDWRLTGDRIVGEVIFHVDNSTHRPSNTITTSRVLTIWRVGAVFMAETLNSLYILDTSGGNAP